MPIYKKGDKTEPGNFRSLSLPGLLVKVMEKIICDYLNQVLNQECTISTKQYGCVRKRSIIPNFFSRVHVSSKELDNKYPVDVVLAISAKRHHARSHWCT